MLLAIAAIVVVAVVVLSLLVTGVLPRLGSSSKKSYGTNLPYSEARPLADAAAAGAPGGPWAWLNAEATYVHTAVNLSPVLHGFFAGLPGVQYLTSALPYVPAFNGSLGSGLSPLWLFVYTNGTTALFGSVVLVVVVVNGTATALASGASPEIAVVPVVGNPIMDSPAVMALAVTENSSFFNAHPEVNASLNLYYRNDSEGVGWFWAAEFNTCPAFEQSDGSSFTYGSALIAVVNDTSGAIVSSLSGPAYPVC